MTLRVAILGACVSRDAFNSKIIPEYKNFFSVVAYQFQMSVISLMQSPIGYDSSDFVGDATEINREHLKTELAKNFLKDIAYQQPDYLIVDFYSDTVHGCLEVEDSIITNKKSKFEAIKAFRDFKVKKSYSPRKNYNEYMKLWESSFDKLCDFVKEKCPRTKILINKARLTDSYYDSFSKELIEINPEKDHAYYSNLNKIWSGFDDYAASKENVRTLNVDKKKYFADKDHIFNLFMVHYKNNFYRDFISELLRISILDLTSKVPNSPRGGDINIIVNGEFNYGSNYWTRYKKPFKVLGPGLEFKELEDSTVKNYQMWSEPYNISSHGDTFILSFEVVFYEQDFIKDDDLIFCLRTFNNKNSTGQDEAITSHLISKKDLNASISGKYEFSREIKLDGTYLRVAPYVKSRGHLSWNKISITKK